MEFRHIRSFLSVAETLHFGRSARLLNLSQPALSLQVKALEDELGIQLLSRNRQGTVLTEAGQAFREDAAVALEKLEFAKRKAQWASAGKLGHIRIGFISSAGFEIVANLMRRFRKSYPDVEFSIRNILTGTQLEMIDDGLLDVGFLRLPIENRKTYRGDNGSSGTIRRDLAFMALAFRKERDSSARTQRESICHVRTRVRSWFP
jgi:DNA-binding transcriptional LysR family regulator